MDTHTKDQLYWAAGAIDGDGSCGIYQMKPFIQYDNNTMDYIAGQIDGDGCINVSGKSSAIDITLNKSIKSIHIIEYFYSLFGGDIRFILKSGNSEAICVWRLRGINAVLFCKNIYKFLHLKKKQFVFGSQYITANTYIEINNNKEILFFNSIKSASEYLKISKDALQLRFSRNGCEIKIKNNFVKRLSKLELAKSRKKIFNDLKDLKNQQDEIVSNVSIPYLSGFFDAEACICINGPNSIRVSIPQAYKNILSIYQQFYGGHIYKDVNTYRWRIYSNNAINLLSAIKPYVREKRTGLLLSLQSNESNWKEIKEDLDKTKGVCMRVGRTKTITTQDELNILENEFKKKLNISSKKLIRNLPKNISACKNRKSEVIGYVINYKKKKFTICDKSISLEKNYEIAIQKLENFKNEF